MNLVIHSNYNKISNNQEQKKTNPQKNNVLTEPTWSSEPLDELWKAFMIQAKKNYIPSSKNVEKIVKETPENSQAKKVHDKKKKFDFQQLFLESSVPQVKPRSKL